MRSSIDQQGTKQMTTTNTNTDTKTELQVHLDTLPTMAAKIRHCLSIEMSRGDTAKLLGIRYQWVRNVAITPIKK